MSWDLVIGLEIHAQVVSRSKLFSSGAVGFGAEPNSQVSFLDVGMPGSLPVLNSFCVEQAVRASLAVGAQVNLRSSFDRKNYFYPDLPLGYQITQFFHPIAENGFIDVEDASGCTKKVRIERIHLEQDAAKIIHDDLSARAYIDFNRAGVALMEIVSAPDMSTVAEVVQYVNNLRMILRYVGACDGDMEKGSLRCDANVSVRKGRDQPMGARCEIKNLNSTNHIAMAITYEMERQISIIERGNKVNQETRLFDVKTGETVRMRDKETSSDYSYFPDPDLLPLLITQEYIDSIAANLPELPAAKQARYESLGLTKYDATVIVSDKGYSEFFEKVSAHCDPKLSCNWLINELIGRLNKYGISFSNSPVSEDKFIELMLIMQEGTISGSASKKVLDALFESDESPRELVRKLGLGQVVDESAIAGIIESVLQENADQVAAYIGGKTKLMAFFVGQVMKLSGGKASPEVINRLLKARLEQ